MSTEHEQLAFPAPRPASTAELDDSGRYRYDLTRTWSPSGPRCGWVMLNPSTADADRDDPTIRRCIGYARAWGFGGITVRNLFAYRARNPADLATAADPVGPGNDAWLAGRWDGVTVVVAAWGTGRWPMLGGRASHVARILRRLDGVRVVCLRAGKDGHPVHPLYQRGDLDPVAWEPPTHLWGGDR